MLTGCGADPTMCQGTLGVLNDARATTTARDTLTHLVLLLTLLAPWNVYLQGRSTIKTTGIMKIRTCISALTGLIVSSTSPSSSVLPAAATATPGRRRFDGSFASQ